MSSYDDIETVSHMKFLVFGFVLAIQCEAGYLDSQNDFLYLSNYLCRIAHSPILLKHITITSFIIAGNNICILCE